MNNSNALAEIQSKYPNCNLLLPAATSVQINPFYKCSVMEVVADTAPNSGDIFSVGKVKTGEDRNGKAVYEEVYSPAKPLLMKLATAAGIQFHPEYTTVTRENTNTYVGKAWLEAMKQIEDLVPKSELDERVGQTVKDIMATTNGKKAAVAWSGGKDSLVLADVCRQAGIEDSVLVVSNLEYSAFTEWVDRNKPPKLEIINTGQDIEWLVKHPQMLFPQDSNTAAQWFHIVQHRGQAKYYKAHELDMILLGRRRADGNYVGKGSNIYTDGKGVTRFSPLADWSHEEVLAYIHYYNLVMPPIYDWKNGYLCGTHPWAARQWTGSIENGWKEVYEIEPDIVKEAAKKIPSAKEFLKGLE